MARPRLSLPHERRKVSLKSAKMKHQVRVAESRETIAKINAELNAMKPAPKKREDI